MKSIIGEADWVLIDDTTLNVSIHEDNYGALILSETLPPQSTPSKQSFFLQK